MSLICIYLSFSFEEIEYSNKKRDYYLVMYTRPRLKLKLEII